MKEYKNFEKLYKYIKKENISLEKLALLLETTRKEIQQDETI